ncbi:MAG: flagellar hook-basal body complex protein, partial [Desulfotomaculales bacterium]
MLRSLYSGITGLRTHQIRMDVVANNIANVNTTGFKSARANFQDVLAQTIGRTAINTTQVGLGVGLAAIDNIHTQGPLQTTGRVLDLAIEGNGFFVVKDEADNIYYTRDGTFYLDGSNRLVNAQGYQLLDNNNQPIAFDNSKTVATISVGIDGKISVTYTGGSNNQGSEPIIGICTFKNVESLRRAGSNLWGVSSMTEPQNPTPAAPKDAGCIIRSGYLEMSNVDLAQEFT